MEPPSPFHFTPKPLRTTTLLMQFHHTSSSLGPNYRRVSSIFNPRAIGKFPLTRSSLHLTRIPSGLLCYNQLPFGHPGLIQQVGSYGRAHREDETTNCHCIVLLDIYLMGTVMLVFGMGFYELFVCNLDIAKTQSKEKATSTSNLFGLFALKERPRWLEIKSVSELKTKLGHVIVMLLLIGFFNKCKKAVIHSTQDLLCFSASVLLSSGCLFLLSKLNGST
ncbi:Membrane protein [Gossypium australe]|uniref:Membrane protein n=1 Tax=Gossypium australe TaxID=47621 RepID=A0A5B6VC93_9ROSI|nr:Membrane protein [Gossypium australe]